MEAPGCHVKARGCCCLEVERLLQFSRVTIALQLPAGLGPSEMRIVAGKSIWAAGSMWAADQSLGQPPSSSMQAACCGKRARPSKLPESQLTAQERHSYKQLNHFQGELLHTTHGYVKSFPFGLNLHPNHFFKAIDNQGSASVGG